MKKWMGWMSLALLCASSGVARADGSIAVLTYLHLKPGTEGAFRKEVAKIIAPSRSEPGNIAWFVQESETDPTQVVFYTRWKDQAALTWHLKSPPLVEYIQRTAELLAEPVKLVRFQPLDGQGEAFGSLQETDLQD